MAKKSKAGWVYCVHGPDFLACYSSPTVALKKAKTLAKKPKATVSVEKAWSDFPGHANPWRKGAGYVFTHDWSGTRGDGRTVVNPQSGKLDPSS